MKTSLPAALCLAAILLQSPPVFAHHSFAAEFDQNAKLDLTGAVTKLQWENPHTHFSLAVKDAAGKIVIWDIEAGAPNALARRGIARESLREGQVLRVQCYRAKDGTNLASAATITFPDGHTAFAGTAGDGSPGN
jgi:hypothetical protein